MSAAEIYEAPQGEALSFEERIHLPGYLGLSVKNGLLNLVTLTLYRFWGKTEVRRRVWSSVSLNGEPFEYTGRGVELFLGFLIALAVIGLPFLIVVFGAQLLGPLFAAAIILPAYLFVFWLFGLGTFTAFRYLASRTAWRGVRFQLTGSAAHYAFSYVALVFLSGLTLGWFWPVAERALARPLWSGLRFGHQKVHFDLARSEAEGVYGAYALGWMGTFCAYFVLSGLVFGVFFRSEGEDMPTGDFAIIIYILFTGILLISMVAFAPYQAAMLRSIAAGVGFGEARFRLAVEASEMVWLTIGNLLMVVFSLGLLMPLVQARTTKFLIERLRVEGVADLEARQAEAGPRTGEGLADAFGIAPI